MAAAALPLASPELDKLDEKFDVEKNGSGGIVVQELASGHELGQGQQLHRGLKSRHIQMISIGGVIGTGLFLGTANALRHGGPLGLLLGYTIMGSMCFSVMVALGEMVSQLPVPGGHITLAKRFVSPSLSFTMGWNYWYNWTIVLPAELSAAAVLISYWNDTVNPAAWISIFLVVVVLINMGGARLYGEAEFWFAIIKVLTICGLIIVGIVISAGGGPDHQAIGFKYWHDPGAFVQFNGIPGSLGQFLGFFAVLSQAAFSYIGTEITAIAAGEAKNPRRNMPRAIKRVYIRILFFYIIGTFIIGILVPSNDPSLKLASTAAKSPFVIAIQRAGISGLPSVINACLLTSAWSAASSDLYTSSRALYSLALSGSAPKIFAKTNSWGLPWAAMIVGTLFALLSYMSCGDQTAGQVFGYFANLTAAAGLLTWIGITFTYLRWWQGIKAQKIDRSKFPYRAPFQPYLTWYGFIGLSIILFFSGFSVFLSGEEDFAADFITQYLPLPLFVILAVGHRIYKKVPMVKASEMDFYSGTRDCMEEEEEAPPRNILERVWRAIM